MKKDKGKAEEFSEQHLQAVEALKRSEERYALAQRAANIGSWDWDIATGELVWSERIEPMFGFARGKFGATYEAFLDCVHPEDRQHVVDSVNACVEQGQDYAIEHRIVWPDGTIRWLSETGDVIRDKTGKAIRMLGVVQDITKHKQAEEALRLHDVRTQSLLDLNKMAKASQQEILDFVREESIKVTQSRFAFIGFLNEDESVSVVENWSKETMAECAVIDKPIHFPVAEAGIWAEAIRQRKPIIINDYTAPHPAKKGIPEGHVLIKRFICAPVFDGEQIVMVAAVANKEKDYDQSDVRALTSMISDTWRLIRQKQNEEEIQNLAKFPSENPNPVLRIAKDGTVLYSNSAGSELLKEWDCEVGACVPEHWHQYVLRILKSGLSEELETVCCKDRIFSLIIAPVVDAGYVNMYGIDVTERKRAEEDLRKYRQHLEELVQDRTREWTEANKQLLQEIEQRKQLEKAILDVSEREQRRIGRELHDSIGQQFTGIAFMTKVLEQKLATKLPEEAAGVGEIAKLVNQAMDQTRGLAKVLHPVDLDAGSLMSALQELALTTENLFGIHCTFKCDKPVPIGDAEVTVHLYRITQEAVTNAIKHGRAKNIHIGLTYGKKESVLTVKNDGVNFPKEFEKRGTGMGLQIMDHRADIIGGFLDIHSGPKGGTIVTCAFPNKRHKQ